MTKTTNNVKLIEYPVAPEQPAITSSRIDDASARLLYQLPEGLEKSPDRDNIIAFGEQKSIDSIGDRSLEQLD